MSRINLLGCDDGHPIDNHRRLGDVPHSRPGRGGHALDGPDHVHSAYYPAEYAIAPSIRRLGAMVQESVVFDVDKELGAGRMRIGRTGHGNGAARVLQAVISFVLNRGVRWL